MAVVVTEHGNRTEIIQCPELAPGTIGRQALLVCVCLAATCIALLGIGVMLWGQQASGSVPPAEFWIGVAIMGCGFAVLFVAALREMSNALPRRITILPGIISVRFATPLPVSFELARDKKGGPAAEVHHRTHKNYGVNGNSSGGYATIRSRKSYVRLGGRLIGPLDNEDAEALAAALNAALRKGASPDQRFSDVVVYRIQQFTLGFDNKTGAHYLSTPITKDGQHHLAEYEAYFRIDPDEFTRFRDDPASAAEFIATCRRNGNRDRLID